MIESFLSVGTQVLILFLMIGTGFVLGKLHLITHKGVVDGTLKARSMPVTTALKSFTVIL